MSFIETPRFPDDISENSIFGPRYSTSVIRTRSGDEYRNINWSYPLSEGDLAFAVRRLIYSSGDALTALETIMEWFHACAGQGHGFRFKDHLDYKSCALEDTVAFDDQTIGTGDASEDEFQLIKTYTKGAVSRSRKILKPVSGTVLVGINGVNQSSGWSVDTTTGIVTFTSPRAMG